MYQIRILFLSIIIFTIFVGCGNKPIETTSINKFQEIKQEPSSYVQTLQPISKKMQNKFIKNFKNKYFYPWNLNKSTMSYKDATWGLIYSKMNVFSENLTPISKEWFDNIIEQSNFESFDTLRKKAITINNSHLKVFPTVSKIFYDPNQAGEGFPFDYNENSSIKLNTPLFISHLSKDKLWAYVESSMASGWIPIADMAYVDSEFIKTFKNGNYYIATKDNTSIYKNGYLLNSINLGTLFPKAKYGFIIAAKDYKNNGFIRVIDKNTTFEKLGIDFTIENIKKLSSELIGERYGWGGLLDNRDCSLMIKDFYTPFGIFLQRNSGMQKNDGKSLDISTLDNEKKKEFIIKNAIPFQTLIYLPGHIMIYVGTKDGEPLVFHNMWGVKTIDSNGNYGRDIVGKAVVSTLTPGSEVKDYSDKYSILSRVQSITILTQ
jgi:cell wall-associated NlpC family hydrolase